MVAQLQDRQDQLIVLEKDLIKKIQDAVAAAGLTGCVHGVFSLDDLENKTEDSLQGGIAFGVAYQGIKPVTDRAPQLNPPQGNAVQMADYMFVVLIAAPVDEFCSQRLTASTLLTILRQGILGRAVVEDGLTGRNSTQRCWNFVQEKPELSESTETMLYYTQVWRLVLPMKGN
jgi:hypothetical protein